jgi:transcriptional regulator with PAS, ATPase and Fis domain
VANRGTVFLDEIGTLGPELQAKLLRFLDERTIRRLGSTDERLLDVQLITATHRDLKAAARLGEFREDLYFRLRAIHLHLPPLRDREGDVVELARSFLEEICREHSTPLKQLSPETQQALLKYRWPGNLRELRNRLERIVLLRDDDVIAPEHLELTAEPARVSSSKGVVQIDLPPEGISMEEVERAMIKKAMEMSKGNISRAARLLGLSRAKLKYRLGK